MHGGYRKGSGRKPKKDIYKKKNRNIYITDDLYNEVMSCDVSHSKSFSQRCEFLIKESLSKLGQESRDEMKELRFIDLFAGIGGIRKGFEDKNTKAVFSSEWDQFAAKTYEANFNEKPMGDITKIKEKDIPDHDVLLAGFPCQPFSSIGKRQGFEHSTQGTLIYDILRILHYHKPKALLLENVVGIMTIQNGKTFEIIINEIEEAGYTVFYKILDAQNFGLAQIRKRVIIVGFKNSLNVDNFNLPEKNGAPEVFINEILEENPEGYKISEHLQKNYLYKKDDGRPEVVDKDSKIKVKTLVSTYHKIQRLTGTFVKGGETGLRLLSELECKRLMGFPEDFIVPVSRTQMYRQFGNSVAVPMIKAVSDEMKKTIYANSKKELTTNF